MNPSLTLEYHHIPGWSAGTVPQDPLYSAEYSGTRSFGGPSIFRKKFRNIWQRLTHAEGWRYIRYDVSLFIAVSLYRDVSLVYRMYLMYRAEKRWEHARSEMYRFYRNLSDVSAPIHPIIDVSEAMMYRIGKPLLPATQASTRPHTDLGYAWEIYHHGSSDVPCVW